MLLKTLATLLGGIVLGSASGFVLYQWSARQPATADAQPVATAEPGTTAWLKGPDDEKLGQIERQLRGFDVTMVEVGYRYDELVAAAKNRNWEYARYQTEKIEHAIRLGLERRPKRAKSATPFLTDAIPPVMDAIKARHPEQLEVAVRELHTGCIECHRAENVLFMGDRFAARNPTSAETAQALSHYQQLISPASLAAADPARGRVVFDRSCANCHRLFGEGSSTGPDLTNLQRADLDYLIKEVVDPSALVGYDFQTVIVAMDDGRTITGFVVREDERSLTLQTATDSVTLAKAEIADQSLSTVSVMPEGLLQQLSDAQVMDLFAYLQATEQVALPEATRSSDGAHGEPAGGDDAKLREAANRLFGILERVPDTKLEEEAVMLGRHLFSDERLSATGQIACASCHLAEDWGADSRRFSRDAKGKDTARNSQSVFNALLQPGLRWTADRRSGAHQAERSLTGSMGFESASDIIPLLKQFGYEAAFRSAFPDVDDPISPSNYALAIQAYEETLVTPAPFDDFLAGENDALTDEQKAGLKLFLTIGCADCHDGPLLGGSSMEKFGFFQDYWTATQSEHRDARLFEVTGEEADRYRFRVSMLRRRQDLALFPRWFRRCAEEAVRVMAEVQLGSRLSGEETAAIASFLGALTGDVPRNYSPTSDASSSNGIPGYVAQFRSVFGTEVAAAGIAKALAAFQRTLRTGPSALDRYLPGEQEALSESARRGMELFVGDAGCVGCHQGPLLSDEKFYRLGLSFADQGLAGVTGHPEDKGRFRTPSLRNVARTGPYMHNSSMKTLDEMVTFYNRDVPTTTSGLPLDVQPLSGQSFSEIPDLVAFLESLTGEPPRITPPELP